MSEALFFSEAALNNHGAWTSCGFDRRHRVRLVKPSVETYSPYYCRVAGRRHLVLAAAPA